MWPRMSSIDLRVLTVNLHLDCEGESLPPCGGQDPLYLLCINCSTRPVSLDIQMPSEYAQLVTSSISDRLSDYYANQS